MPDYPLIKLLHQSAVALSITGFGLRGALMLKDSPLLRERWMRTWPHVIDTVLLASGIWMATLLHLNPLAHPWLTSKIVALLAYIGLGFVALRLGRTRGVRIAALVAALACFAYMAAVAITKSPLPLPALADVVDADRDPWRLGPGRAVAVDREVARAVDHRRDIG